MKRGFIIKSIIYDIKEFKFFLFDKKRKNLIKDVILFRNFFIRNLDSLLNSNEITKEEYYPVKKCLSLAKVIIESLLSYGSPLNKINSIYLIDNPGVSYIHAIFYCYFILKKLKLNVMKPINDEEKLIEILAKIIQFTTKEDLEIITNYVKKFLKSKESHHSHLFFLLVHTLFKNKKDFLKEDVWLIYRLYAYYNTVFVPTIIYNIINKRVKKY